MDQIGLGMRQIEERHIANQVDKMVWSHSLDLLALSNFKGDVQIHRLHWQKVWSLPTPQENDTVQAMAWRPDGKAIAIAYTSYINVIDLEDKEVLYTFSLNKSNSLGDEAQNISCLTWAVKSGIFSKDPDQDFYDDASIFLPKLSASSSYKNHTNKDVTKNLKEISEQNQLHMLITGYGKGNIDMRIFGTSHFGHIKLSDLLKNECNDYRVLDIMMTDDFNAMQILYLDITLNCIYLAVINTAVLNVYAKDIFYVANTHGEISRIITHLDQTMAAINEAWEHILLEMDTKMADYAASVPEGGVSADFLELLMLGVPSDELELFLLQELTAKGLKKFGNSVELSYSTIQKLVLKQLNTVGQSMVFLLSELRGHTRMPDRFKMMGLEEETVSAAIKASFAFLNKCLELQQVIDVSMKNYKTFFRWLFVVIVRLLDEQTPSEIVKISQQDLTHIAEFLYNFDSVKVENPDGTTNKTVKFNLERLGQYLQNKDLTLLPDDDSEDNPWHKFLNDNPCFLKDNETVYSVSEFKTYSLVLQQEYLKQTVYNVFDSAKNEVKNNFCLVKNIRCYEVKNSNKYMDNLIFSQQYDNENQTLFFAFLDKNKENCELNFISISALNDTVSAGSFIMSHLMIYEKLDATSDRPLNILDLQFYSHEFLSILLNDPDRSENSIYLQLPIKLAIENSVEVACKVRTCVFTDRLQTCDLSPFIVESVYRILEKMDGIRLAASGGRKVAVVLSKTRRKVRVFEMEVGDEDDDDEIQNNSNQRMKDSISPEDLTSTSTMSQ